MKRITCRAAVASARQPRKARAEEKRREEKTTRHDAWPSRSKKTQTEEGPARKLASLAAEKRRNVDKTNIFAPEKWRNVDKINILAPGAEGRPPSHVKSRQEPGSATTGHYCLGVHLWAKDAAWEGAREPRRRRERLRHSGHHRRKKRSWGQEGSGQRRGAEGRRSSEEGRTAKLRPLPLRRPPPHISSAGDVAPSSPIIDATVLPSRLPSGPSTQDPFRRRNFSIADSGF